MCLPFCNSLPHNQRDSCAFVSILPATRTTLRLAAAFVRAMRLLFYRQNAAMDFLSKRLRRCNIFTAFFHSISQYFQRRTLFFWNCNALRLLTETNIKKEQRKMSADRTNRKKKRTDVFHRSKRHHKQFCPSLRTINAALHKWPLSVKIYLPEPKIGVKLHFSTNLT